MRHVFQNFSWATLTALPPTEFLALVLLALLPLYIAFRFICILIWLDDQ